MVAGLFAHICSMKSSCSSAGLPTQRVGRDTKPSKQARDGSSSSICPRQRPIASASKSISIPATAQPTTLGSGNRSCSSSAIEIGGSVNLQLEGGLDGANIELNSAKKEGETAKE